MMKDKSTSQGDNNSEPDDDRLVKELESSNKTYDSVNFLELGSDIEIETERCYKILRITPEASLAEIHEAFEKMNEAWHPDRYPHVYSWREKSQKKLLEIRSAYEKLVRLYPQHESISPTVPKNPDPLAAIAEKPGSSEHEKPLPQLNQSPESLSVSSSAGEAALLAAPATMTVSGISVKLLSRIALMALPVMTAFILVFLWPSPYHYTVINLGGKDYPLRINRFTSHTAYYNGTQWTAPPAQNGTRKEKTAAALTVPPPSLSPAVQPNQPSPISPQVKSEETSKPAMTVQPVKPVPPLRQVEAPQQPLPPETRRGEIRVASKPPSNSEGRQSVRAVPKEVPSNLKKSPKINAAKPYSVQIIAYPEKDKAEAYAKNMRANKFSVRVEEVAIKGKGRWHRVLLGHFKSRDEALKYYNDHMLKKLYPQSFIQKQADSQ